MAASTVTPGAESSYPSLEVAREVAQVLVAFLLYNLGRMLATHELGRADAHAHDVVDVERWLRLPAEATVQTWALGHDWIVDVANRYYVSVHFPLTIGVLVWLCRYRRPAYHWAKRALLGATAVALAFTVLLPVTPPAAAGPRSGWSTPATPGGSRSTRRRCSAACPTSTPRCRASTSAGRC